MIVTLSFSLTCRGQYTINREKFDTHRYSYQVDDPNNPVLMALSSAVIPGLGQIFEGETDRGIDFLGGFLPMVLANRLFTFPFKSDLTYTQRYNLRTGALVGKSLLRIWSALDAMHVAKINNLAFREKYKSDLSIKVFPYPNLPEPYYPGRSFPVGITFIVSF
jgi:hypothetical protein